MTAALTFGDKIAISALLMAGQTPQAIAENYKTRTEVIKEIDRSFLEMMEVWRLISVSQHLVLKGGQYPQMESVLYSWFSEVNRNVSNKEFSEKAKRILHITNEQPSFRSAVPFTGSNNWVNAFKMRYGIPVARRNAVSTPVNNFEGDRSVEDPESFDADFQPAESFASNQDDTKVNREGDRLTEEEERDIDYALQIYQEEQERIDYALQTAQVIASNQDDPIDDTENEFEPEAEVQDTPPGPALYDHPIESVGSISADAEWDDVSESSFGSQGAVTQTINQVNPSDLNHDAQNVDDRTDSHDDEQLKSNKRKRATCTAAEEYSSPVEFSEAGSSNASKKKKFNEPEKVIVMTKNGAKAMTVEDYEVEKVIRIFKPVLRYAKDSCWSKEDSETLGRLYRKSLKSCAEKAKQATITDFLE